MRARYGLSCLCVLSLMAAGCFKTNKVPGLGEPSDSDSEPEAGRGGVQDPPSKPNKPNKPDEPAGPDSEDQDASNRCVRGGLCGEIAVDVVDAADLLFVVDNSGSMRQEQTALREQFPRLITTLTTGRKSNGESFPPVRDLHLGVVSSDMGLAGIANNFPGCNTQRHINGGDDGVLLHPGLQGPGCASMYPPFLSFVEGQDNPNQVAVDFGCIAAIGTTGCGFEQQLEAGLKALWPKTYVDGQGNVYPPEKNPILFLSTTNEGRFGHGDGQNSGFLRKDSLVAIVVVTDEEDCSAKNTAHFISTNDPMNPLSRQGINLRCFYNKQNLFEVERYIKGFQGLRPGREQRVVFAAIAGVPADLVSAEARTTVDFGDQSDRDAYYDKILGDPRMAEMPQNENVPAIANVKASCTRTDAFGDRADAFPPRRIVEVAKGFGENATVQSICQDDFGPAIDAIIDLTARRTQVECLPKPLARDGSGKVDCDVLWELPLDGEITKCSERPFLSDVASPRSKRGANGGRVCKVSQLPVTTLGSAPTGEGFYYDDFSEDRAAECHEGTPQRIAFTAGAKPPAGVHAFLDCSTKATSR